MLNVFIPIILFSNPNFLPLVKHLAPMYFRVGGTTADTVLFVDSSEPRIRSSVGEIILDSKWNNMKTYSFNSCFTGSFLEQLSAFTKQSDVNILLDLNSLLRNSDGSWDSSNAEELISFASQHNIQLNFELGNGKCIFY